MNSFSGSLPKFLKACAYISSVAFPLMFLPSVAPLGHVAAEDFEFTYNGVHSANSSLDGISEFTSDGLLRLTNSSQLQEGHVFLS